MRNEDIFSTEVEIVLPALKSELQSIKSIWFPRSRKGDGEAGRILERELCVPENNRDEADIPIADLKTATATTKTTLFSKEGKLLISKEEIYKRFGFAGKKHLLSLQSAVNLSPNGQHFFYHCEDDGVYLTCRDVDIQFWSWDLLSQCFSSKFPAVFTVHYETKKINDVEHFKFTHAYYFPSLKTTFNSFLSAFKQGNITIEVRRYMTAGKERNRGTAFRVNQQTFNQIFQTRTTII